MPQLSFHHSLLFSRSVSVISPLLVRSRRLVLAPGVNITWAGLARRTRFRRVPARRRGVFRPQCQSADEPGDLVSARVCGPVGTPSASFWTTPAPASLPRPALMPREGARFDQCSRLLPWPRRHHCRAMLEHDTARLGMT